MYCNCTIVFHAHKLNSGHNFFFCNISISSDADTIASHKLETLGSFGDCNFWNVLISEHFSYQNDKKIISLGK